MIMIRKIMRNMAKRSIKRMGVKKMHRRYGMENKSFFQKHWKEYV